MSLAALLEQLRLLRIECRVEGDQLRVSAPDGALTPELVATLRSHKAELLTHFGTERPTAPAIVAGVEAPLSLAQERLWFLESLGRVGAAYHVSGAVRLRGGLDAEALAAAFACVQRGQGQLRTRFGEVDGRPVQREVADVVALERRDWLGDVDAALAAVRAEAQVPFEITGGPLVRAALHRVAAHDHVLAITVHHLISDGASLSILIREWMSAYASIRSGGQPALSTGGRRYVDLALEQRRAVDQGVFARDVEYWREVLADAPEAIRLPTDHPRPAQSSFAGAAQRIEVPAELARAMAACARQYGATPFMAWLAAYALVLMRTSGQQDVVIGIPVSQRTTDDAQRLVGLFVNALPVRLQADPGATLASFISHVRARVLEAMAHADAPWEHLLEALQPARDVSRSPVFQVSFTLQDHPVSAFAAHDLVVEEVPTPIDAAKFEWSLELQPTPDGRLAGVFEYNTDLFDADSVAQAAGRLVAVAAQIAQDPHRPIEDVEWLAPGELDRLREAWCGPRVPFDLEGSIADAFERVARSQPDRPAVVLNDRLLTFGDLLARSHAVAAGLTAQGVTVGQPVGVLVDRTPETIVNLLGVLAAGGAYVPIDPSWPAERRVAVESSAGVALVLGAGTPAAPSVGSWQRPLVPADSPAYVLFTSGSTGVPKGVVVEQRSVRHLIEALEFAVYAPLGIGRHARVTVNGALTFDTSVKQVFQLLQGRTLVLVPDETRLDGAMLLGHLQRQRVEVLDATPSQLTWLVEAGLCESPGAMRAVLAGGEALSAALWGRMRRPGAPALVNLYGPTECTVDATAHVLRPSDEAPLLGRPLPNVDVLILDPQLRPVPVGVAGEIVIGGPGVARGYVGQPEATAQAFVANPFAFVGSSTVYRTGDRGRVRPDGRLEFLGRVDDQVKVRGHRVELGDIDQALLAHEAVQAAATLLVDQDRVVAAVAVDPRRAPVVDGHQRYALPNGLSIVQLNPNETDFLYAEMFERNAYLRHGIHLRDDAVVVDLGANIGMFALLAHTHQPRLRLLCVEPNPHVRALLEANLRLHGADAQVVACGIGASDGLAEFTFYPGFSILSGLHADLADEKAVVRSYIRRQREAGTDDEAAVEEVLAAKLRPVTLPVRLRPLGDVIDEAGITTIDLLKINVEKAELEVLEGLRDRHWAAIRQIALELHDERGRLAAALTLLRDRGFEVTVEEDWSLEDHSGTNYYLYAHRPGAGAPQPPVSAERLAALAPPLVQGEDVREHVRRRLPDYMVPDVVRVVDRLPVTSHGKVDRRALARWSWTRAGQGDGRPFTPHEARLADLWRDVLDVDELGPHDHFFLVGGHSLSAARLAARIRDVFQVPLGVGAIFDTPILADMAAAIGAPVEAPARAGLEAHGLSGPQPLSSAQERLLFLERLDGGGAAYVIAGAMRLEGSLSVAALQAAVDDVVAHHAVLRSVFVAGDTPHATVVDRRVVVGVEDWRERGLAAESPEVQAWIRVRTSQGFSLETELPVRVQLLTLSPDRHVLVVSCHHLVADGWSVAVFLRDLSVRYGLHAGGRADPWPPATFTYYDFARWQRDRLADEQAADDLAFWRRTLEGAAPALELPTDHPRPPVTSYAGRSFSWRLGPEMRARVDMCARRSNSTPYMVWLAAFAALLHRWSGQQDIVIGSPVAGRTVAGVDELVGLFVNTVALRLDFEEVTSFDSLLRAASDVTRRALDRQDVPFEQVVEAVKPPRRLDRHPVFQVMFALQNLPDASLTLPGVRWAPIPVESTVARFDLSLILEPASDGYQATFEYSTALFDASTIARLVPQLERLITAVCDAPSSAVRTVVLTTPEDLAAVRQWNATTFDFGPFVPVAAMVRGWTERTPEATAITYRDSALTYAELRRRTDQLAGMIRSAGLPRHGVVALYLDRSPAWVIGVLAALEAGAVFLPIDPEFPAERVQWMLDDSTASVVVTHREIWARLAPPATHVHPVFIDDLVAGAEVESPLPVTPAPDEPAYLIYTSGSTGRPKGALNAHRGFSNLIRNFIHLFNTSPASQSLHFSSISFDSSLCEVFMALAAGGTLVLADRDEILPGAPLERVLRERAVTHATIPPSALGGMLDPDAPALAVLLSAGEACPPEVVQRWAGSRRFYNAYGPTESSVCSIVRRCVPGEVRIPIGRPLHNVTAFVLDPARRQVPVGVPGELAIGGVGVAIGYWNRPELTAERFVDIDPYDDGGSVRVYLTGDQARLLANGEIEFLGRKDAQVKLRGYRIELGEIEAAMRAHPGVRDCAVVVQATEDGSKRLVAFVVDAEAPPSVKALKDHLRTRLPEYMVPPIVVRLDRIPQTTAGKRHTRALEQWDVSGAVGVGDADHAEPVSPEADAVAAIFAEVLGRTSFPPHADFFEQGGHSLLAARVIGRVREGLGIDLTLRALFETPTPVALAARVPAAAAWPPVQAVDDHHVVSAAQRRLWFLEALQPSDAYTIVAAVRLTGPLDVARFERAVRALSARHEILRSAYPAGDGEPRVVFSAEPIPLRIVEVPAAQVLAQARAEARAPFDLAHGPLFRPVLYRSGPHEHLFVASMHHIVADGWSIGVLVRDLVAAYRGHETPWPLQYGDYARWCAQVFHEEGSRVSAQLDHWQRRLDGAALQLDLPTDRSRPPEMTSAGGVVRTRLDVETRRLVEQLAADTRATEFVVLHAAFAGWLARLAGQYDFVIGTPVANRRDPAVEAVVGLFVNTLPLRVQIDPALPVRTLVEQTRAQVLEDLSHPDVPFDRIVQAIRPERDRSRTPIFQVMFALTSDLVPPMDLDDGVTITPVSVDLASAKFDLTLFVERTADGYDAAFEYRTDIFRSATIEGWAGGFAAWVRTFAESATAALADLPLASDADVAALEQWNGVAAGHVALTSLTPDLVEASVDRHPEAVAVAWADGQLTYRSLDHRANQLAALLRAQGVGPETVVAVCLPRSPDLVVSLLAIWKAGGAYLPIDPHYPAERQTFMLRDSGAPVLLTSAALAGRLPMEARAHTAVLALDLEAATLSRYPLVRPARSTRASDLAYIIYTSGSTGVPKGVLIEHGGLANYLTWAVAAYGMTGGAGVPVAGSIGFDATITSLFGPLVAGQRLVLIPEGAEVDALADPRATGADHTLWKITPSHLDAVTAQLTGADMAGRVRHLVVGGEALSGATLRPWATHAPATLVTNEYGPTETVVGCVVHTRPAAALTMDVVPIGRPIANTEILVLDQRRQPVCIGAVGEMYIAGAGVARGYLNRPEQTAERFLDLEVRRADGSRVTRRWYRTGDLVRWNADGELEFLGRQDDQVKLRGHRIELGEIEAAAVRHPSVSQAAAFLDTAGAPRLVLCIVPAGPRVDAAGVLALLRDTLPAVMVPSALIEVERLPLTPNGKLDRHALRAFVKPAPPATVLPDPGDGLAAFVAGAWAEVLGSPPAAPDTHFFDAGGHSLLAAQLVARLRELCGVSLPVRAVFDHPTPAALAGAVRAARTGGAVLPPIVARPGPPALSFGQQRLWALSQFDQTREAYHIPALFALRGPLDVEALTGAWQEVCDRHAVLRMAIASADGQPVAIDAPVPPSLTVLDSSDDGPMLERVRARLSEPFRLDRGPLARAVLARDDADRWWFGVTLHHLVSDGWSSRVMVRDLERAYQRRLDRATTPLEPLPFQYADYAAWQRDVLDVDTRHRLTAYWRDALAGAPPVLALPLDHPRPGHQQYTGAVVRAGLDADARARVVSAARAARVTPYMVLLSAWTIVLAHWSRQRDLVVGTTIANRDQPGTGELIGFFVNTLPIRFRWEPDATVSGLLAHARDQVLAAMDHQALPFEHIVEAVVTERNPAVPPVVQALFTYQPVDADGLRLTGLEVTPEELPHRSAKFDVTLAADDRADGIDLWLEYRSDLFNESTMALVMARVVACVDAMTVDVSRPLSALPLMTREERDQLARWNQTDVDFGETRAIHVLIGDQARRSPEAVALRLGAQVLSYGELDSRALQLAAELRALGVGRDNLVGVYLERSFELFIAVLGILKAGAAYVPLDPEYPEARLAGMVADAGLSALVTTREHRATAPVTGGIPVVTVEMSGDADPSGDLPAVADADLAYCIFTSGSTGRPKGAAIPHGAIRNRLLWMQQFTPLGADDVVLHKTPISFDVSVWELFWPLMFGASISIARPGGHRDAAYLADLIRADAVTTAHFVPSMLQVFLEEPAAGSLPSLRRVFVSGEALSWETARRFADRVGCRLHNLYGPTEAAVDVTWWTCDLGPTPHAIPIGRPIANTRIHILDERLERVPLGVPGELFIGGVNLARGYVGQPALTAERFVVNPFAHEAGEGARLYRTGDLARWRADGQIEYLGRLDTQVKLRGFRIELGEIETTLMTHASVAEAAVAVVGQRLVAYVVPARGQIVDESALRAFLKARVPEYMAPTAYMAMAGLPLGPSGKLDRRALPPPPAGSAGLASPPVARPSSPVEQTLLAIWREVLDVSALDVDANFFDAGGDSLRAIQVAAKARAAGVQVTPALLLDHQTIRALAAACEALPAPITRDASAEQGPLTGPVPAPPIVHWFAGLELAARHHFNQAVVVETPPGLSPAILERALRVVTSFHDSLRLRAVLTSGSLALKYGNAEDAGIFTHRPGGLVADIVAETQAGLGPATGPLWRAVYMTSVTGETGRLLWVIHHLGVDAVSWPRLLNDLADACRDLSRGVEPDLARGRGKPASWRQWALAWKAAAEAGRLDDERDFWRRQVSRLPPAPPRNDQAPEVRRHDRLPLTGRGTLSQEDVLAALWSAWRTAGLGHALAVDLEGHGRVSPDDTLDVSQTVGWFTAVYPLVFDGDGDQPLTTHVRQRLASVPRSGAGFGALRYLAADPVLSAAPRPAVLFNYLGRVDAGAGVDGWRAAEEDSGPATSPHNRSPYALELVVGVQDGHVHFHWHSPVSGLGPGVVDQLAAATIDALRLPPSSCLVPLASGRGEPLFLVHPAGGTVFCYGALARLLDMPVWGLQAPGLHRGELPVAAVEPLARHYVDALCRVAPDGALRLGGWSYGGIVVLEMARQLRARGRHVEPLVIFDTLAPGAMPDAEWRKDSATLLVDVFGGDAGVVADDLDGLTLDEQLTRVTVQAVARGVLPQGYAVDDARRAWRVFMAHRHAERTYGASVVDVDAVVFSSDLRRADADQTLGWARWVRDVRVIHVPGTHQDVLRPPVVSTVAEVIQAVARRIPV